MEKKAEAYSVISNITRVASGQVKIRRFSVATDATDLTSGDSDMDSHVSERILGYAVAKFFRGCTIASALQIGKQTFSSLSNDRCTGCNHVRSMFRIAG